MQTLARILFGTLATATLLAPPYLAGATTAERRSTLDDQREVAVTIYNQDLALVKDLRQVQLQKGDNSVAFREVSARIRPETALLRNLTRPEGFFLIEQNFDFDLLTPNKLLEKYVGKRVGVVKTHPTTGAETIEDAQVLSANDGVVLRIGDRIETGIPGRIIYREVPANLRDRPTLVVKLHSPRSATQDLQLSYLTGGLAWKADYVAELNADDTTLDLNGWVTLTNRSGTSYHNAKLQLVAGDVHRVREKLARVSGLEETAMIQAAAPRMVEESLFEYHLYTLDRPTTVADNQTKQVALLSASGVPVEKEFLLRGLDYYYRSSYGDIGQKLKVGVYVDFTNSDTANMGMPLPKGVVRVYKQDSGGNTQFVGEDRVDHTPKNETVRLKLGDAFDITADKRQTNFKKRAAVGTYSHVFDSSYEIVLKNAKTEPVTVKVMEPIPGDWEIRDESHGHLKAAAGTAVWNIPVPAEGKATLTYTARVRF